MSATFKNAKKQVLKAELRKYMNDYKEKNQKVVKKIESPLAKYNELGQLTCILCKSIVRSEAVWQVHINSKQHKQNIELAKQLKERTKNFTTAIKRPITPPAVQEPSKKLKSILKNAPSKKVEVQTAVVKEELPKDFFDSTSKNVEIKLNVNNPINQNEEMEVDSKDELLPEGFFDDPKLDAKARNVEYKNPVEEEWEKFQKEIRDADSESAAIIAEDQDEATNERQIDEIEEQMKNWSRVVDLEKKKVQLIPNMGDLGRMEEDSPSSDDENIDEFLDWRSKKAYK